VELRELWQLLRLVIMQSREEKERRKDNDNLLILIKLITDF